MIKIKIDKIDNNIYIHFTKNCFLHFLNDWKQMFGKWNWISVNFIQIYFEKDIMTGGYEFECMLLGLGFRIRYTYDDSKIKKWSKEVSKIIKKNEKK